MTGGDWMRQVWLLTWDAVFFFFFAMDVDEVEEMRRRNLKEKNKLQNKVED